MERLLSLPTSSASDDPALCAEAILIYTPLFNFEAHVAVLDAVQGRFCFTSTQHSMAPKVEVTASAVNAIM